MAAFIDFQCPKCGKRGGFCGEMKDHPGCIKCGWKPTLQELEGDEKELEAFRELLRGRNQSKIDVAKKGKPALIEEELRQKMLED